MAKVKINKRWCDTVSEPGVYWDHDLACFGAVVGANRRGKKRPHIGFCVQYRNGRGKSARVTFGSYGAWTPDKAREQAMALLRDASLAKIGKGDDPAEHRQRERDAITLKELIAEYQDGCERGLILNKKGKPKKASTIVTDKCRFPRLLRIFGDKTVKSIVRADCQRCLNELMKGKHGAARTYGLLGALLQYAVERGYADANPARGVRRPADGTVDYRLDDKGWRVFGDKIKAAEERGVAWQAVELSRLLALSGLRPGEGSRLRWSEVDIAGQRLILDDTKTDFSIRPLGKPAIHLLQRVKDRPGRFNGDYVFPSTIDPRKPYASLTKQGAWGSIIGDGIVPGDGATPEHLRHAYGSQAGELGYSELVIGGLLGNGKGSVTARYVKLDAVLLSAAHNTASHIWAAMTGETADVADIEAERKARAS